MDHLNDKQLLNMLTNKHTDVALTEHVAVCAACAGRLQALQEPWDVLGQWTVDTPEIDLTERIMDRVQANRPIYLIQPQALIRIAASIIIGVGAGAWLALGSWLVVLSFKLNNEAVAVSHDASPTYIALISAVCMYLVISSAMYIRCLQVHARGSSASQEASDPPTAIHFVEHNEP